MTKDEPFRWDTPASRALLRSLMATEEARLAARREILRQPFSPKEHQLATKAYLLAAGTTAKALTDLQVEMAKAADWHTAAEVVGDLATALGAHKVDYLSISSCKPGREDNGMEIIGGDVDHCLSVVMFSDSGQVVVSQEDEARILAMLQDRQSRRLRAAHTHFDEWCASCMAYKYERGCACRRLNESERK